MTAREKKKSNLKVLVLDTTTKLPAKLKKLTRDWLKKTDVVYWKQTDKSKEASKAGGEKSNQISVVYVTSSEMKKLNKKFRKKDYVTDILRFVPTEPGSLGELVISLEKIKTQAKEHDLSTEEELGYMLIHGYLHALGFDHESSKRDAKRMFGIQDDLFAHLCHIFFEPKRSKKNVTAGRKRRS